jgi:hypothetical protein
MHICNRYFKKNDILNIKIHNYDCLHNFQINCTCNIIEQVVNIFI